MLRPAKPVRNVVQEKYRANIANQLNGARSGPARSMRSTSGWWSDEEARLYEIWAGTFDAPVNKYTNPYFDYYYSGQDVSVQIEGLETDVRDKLTIYGFGYTVQQQKQPVYGAFSYTYDAMLRGTRIISGAFSLVIREPFELQRKIAKATTLRAKTTAMGSLALNSLRGIDEDEANIERYWRRHYDYNLDPGQQHLFSIHPPFNFIIRYGLQTTSLSTEDPSTRSEDIRQAYKSNTPMYTNVNERLVPNFAPELEHKILLENVELISKSIEYNVDGDPIMENYAFVARDERPIYGPQDQKISGPPQNNPYGGFSGGAGVFSPKYI